MGAKEDQHKETVRSAIEAFNRQDLDAYWSYHTEDTTSHEVYFPKPLTKDEMSEFVPELWEAYPDWNIDLQTVFAEGDLVAVENIMTGTLENDHGDIKATGKSFNVREGVFFQMKDGKIQHVRVYLDRKTMNEQLGIA